jgi:YidC/Oxa1 family membrane protein insertase
MNVFFELVANLLALIYAVVPNYAIAIIGLTLAIMIVVTPLTLKGTRSMMMMQQLQPQMKKIQTQYKDDRQKLNEELLKFYKENDISPLGGCLPLLVQMPVFIVLYQVLRGLTRRVSGMGFDMGWVSGQVGTGGSPTKAPAIDRNFDPAFLNHKSKMYVDLSNTNTMQAFGMNLAESASQALKQGLVHALPYLFLILIVGVTGVIQQRQIQGRNPNQQVNPQQQMIMKIMPIFLPVISFTLPAGLVLYFAVSNLYRVGQQWFISRSVYGIKGDSGPTGAGSKPIEAASKPADEPIAASGGGMLAGLKRAAGMTTNETGTSSAKAPKGGATSAKKKSTAGTSASARKTTSTGRTTPSKKSTATESTGTTKSETARTAPAKKSSGAASGSKASTSGTTSKGGSSNAPQTTPPLQPRARKNKKG